MQDITADCQTLCERRVNSQVDGPIIPFSARTSFLVCSLDTLRTRREVGLAIFLKVDAEDLGTIPLGKDSNQKRWTFPRETTNCMPIQDGGNLARRTAVLYRCVLSQERPHARTSRNSLQKKKKPEIQIQMSKLEKISGASWKDYRNRNHVAPRTKTLCSERRFPRPELLMFNKKQKQASKKLQEATIDGFGMLMETCHCPDAGSV